MLWNSGNVEEFQYHFRVGIEREGTRREIPGAKKDGGFCVGSQTHNDASGINSLKKRHMALK